MLGTLSVAGVIPKFWYFQKPLCYPMLVMQVAILLLVKPMPKFFKDVVIPTLLHFWRKYRQQ